MAAILEKRRAVPPPRENAQTVRSKQMPKRAGVYIHFGGDTAEKGRKVFDLAEEKVVLRRSRPPPGPDEKEDDKITLNPAPDDPRAVHVEKLLAMPSAKPAETDDLPTYQTAVKRNTPAVEKRLLTDDRIARETHSFAPPPLPSAIIEEQMDTEVRNNKVVPITVAKGWKPQRERKPSITPTKTGWEFDVHVQDALVVGE